MLMKTLHCHSFVDLSINLANIHTFEPYEALTLFEMNCKFHWHGLLAKPGTAERWNTEQHYSRTQNTGTLNILHLFKNRKKKSRGV